MRSYLYLALVFLFAVSAGCAATSTTARPEEYEPPAVEDEAPVKAATQDELQALFAADSEQLTPDEIDKVLAARIQLPSQARVVILPLEPGKGARFNEPDYSYLEGGLGRDFTDIIRNSPRIYDASIMTRVVAPKNSSLMALRSAAARFQADLILLYRPSFDTTEARKILLKDKAHGLCTVEAALIDTRTGMVLFTAVSVQEFVAQKSSNDLKFEEAKFKARLGAVRAALTEIAEGLVTFMDAVPG